MAEERVIEEIEYRVLDRDSAIATALFIALILLLYAYYVVEGLNRVTATFLGLSVAFAYSLTIWLGLIAVLVYAFLVVWR